MTIPRGVVRLGLAGLAAAALLAACLPVATVPLDPASRTFYETARLVMTGEEQQIFNHLPDAESRQEFIKDFWDKRDPDPNTEVNEFREEFERRIQYANKHFFEGRKGINTDRGRIYLYLGPPEKVDDYPYAQIEGSLGAMIWWIYYSHQLAVKFVDARGTGDYRIEEVQGSLAEAVDRAKLGNVTEGGGRGTRFFKFALSYDRGGKQFILSIPVKGLSFKDEGGTLRAEFEFDIYVYNETSHQQKIFSETRAFEGTSEAVAAAKDLRFSFPYDLPPGKNFVDVIIAEKGGNGKARKIFQVRL